MTAPRAAELTFQQIQVGETFRLEHCFTHEDVDRYAAISGDFSPLHMDANYATASGFSGRVVHGMLLAALFSQLVGMRIPGRQALYLAQDLAFRRPVTIGEPVTAMARVIGKNPNTATILLATEIRNAEDQIAVGGMARIKIRDQEFSEPPAASAPETPIGTGCKTALVTGATGGIGAVTARQLAAAGWAVGVHYCHNEEKAKRLVQQITASGGTACALQADLNAEQAPARLIQATLRQFGRLDGLVHAVSGELHHRPWQDLEWSHFKHHLDLQLQSVHRLCQAAYPHLKTQGGAVVHLLSQVVWETPPGQMADYVAAKYALKGYSKALAVAWAEEGIRVNTVSPGLLRTELTEHLNERIFKGEIARTPLHRLATPEDVAQAVVFLLGEQATFLTGVDLPLTGGQVMN
ncbi:MAG: SDR family oxidoreductase [Magnetococcales bacterium]|nr:SDR family oxidoreductase [Magnetococcales bacterium]NGZ06266.1 SDR family oxidoreductase [Magnetococcales bacterium]